MEPRDILFSLRTRMLLEECGAQDRKNNVDRDIGWNDIAVRCGFDPYAHTPALEAYLDGYYR